MPRRRRRLVADAGQREAVLALSRTVPAGAVSSDGDLPVVEVATDAGLRALAASERSRVVGRGASVTLVAGSLLVENHLGKRLLAAPGESVVAVVLKGTRVPPSLSRLFPQRDHGGDGSVRRRSRRRL